MRHPLKYAEQVALVHGDERGATLEDVFSAVREAIYAHEQAQGVLAFSSNLAVEVGHVLRLDCATQSLGLNDVVIGVVVDRTVNLLALQVVGECRLKIEKGEKPVQERSRPAGGFPSV
ncbi:hypothetical protein [Streptomyces sp. NPDC058280]|uniref:hypothetical protein n=1 Tax=Streptomyces sp. NPDC058280 TaxID=3346419 RepID=UPI0036E2A11A